MAPATGSHAGVDRPVGGQEPKPASRPATASGAPRPRRSLFSSFLLPARRRHRLMQPCPLRAGSGDAIAPRDLHRANRHRRSCTHAVNDADRAALNMVIAHRTRFLLVQCSPPDIARSEPRCSMRRQKAADAGVGDALNAPPTTRAAPLQRWARPTAGCRAQRKDSLAGTIDVAKPGCCASTARSGP